VTDGAAERRGLPRPHRREIARACGFRLGAQRRKRARGERKRGRNRIDRPDLAHHAIDDAARRPAGHQVGDGGGVILRGGERRPMRRRNLRLGTVQIGGADIGARRAQRKRRRNPARVAQATGRDHRHLHRIDDLRHQRERADLRGDILGEKHAAMPARLRALRDHGINAARLEPARLRRRGRRRDYDAAGRLHALQQRRLRQPEMEADHLGIELLDHGAIFVIERRAVGDRHRRRRIDRKLFVIRLERLAPGALARIVRHRRRVAEEAERHRLPGMRADLADLFAQDRGRKHCAGQRAEPARFRHRRRQFPIHGARHRRKHDREFDLEQVDQSAIRPHRRRSRCWHKGRHYATDAAAALSARSRRIRAARRLASRAFGVHDNRPQQCLYRLPDPQGQSALRDEEGKGFSNRMPNA
jgi:hypothetical protein